MAFSVFDRGEGCFDLMRGDAEIGWIADRAVGFGGFENAAAAHRAAAIAYEALTGRGARQRRIDAAARNAHALRVRRNGGVEQLTLGDMSGGRLFPHAAAMARLRSLAAQNLEKKLAGDDDAAITR